jgi:hypothetical protein
VSANAPNLRPSFSKEANGSKPTRAWAATDAWLDSSTKAMAAAYRSPSARLGSI